MQQAKESNNNYLEYEQYRINVFCNTGVILPTIREIIEKIFNNHDSILKRQEINYLVLNFIKGIYDNIEWDEELSNEVIRELNYLKKENIIESVSYGCWHKKK